MQIQQAFSQQDIERLFLTYKRKPLNYEKIKNTVIGDSIDKQYRKNQHSALLFIITVSFVIIVGSAFSLVAGHWNTFISLLVIWGFALAGYFVWRYITYRLIWRTYQSNKTFFEDFEQNAQDANSLEDFIININVSH